MKLRKSLITFFVMFYVSFLNCLDVPRDNAADRGGDNYDSIYSDNRITEFFFGDLQVSGVIDHEAGTIVVPVLYGSDVTALAPEFTTSAEFVTINGREQRSGITVNNYSVPLIYEVTALDGSYREYAVSVQEIVFASFYLSDPALPWENEAVGTIDYQNSTVSVPVPFYMNITNLVVNFNAAGSVTYDNAPQESGITAHDFSNAGTVPFVFTVEADNGEVQEYRVTAAYREATVSHFAGPPGGVGSADGTGSAASFRDPFGITSDMNNLYIADTYNHTIRKIEISTGIVSTLAGSPAVSGYADGTGSAAIFNYPHGITTDGVNLYVADTVNQLIRKIVISTAEVTTLAGIWYNDDSDGNGLNDIRNFSNSTDGTGATAYFCRPMGIATDGVNLYVSDTLNHLIRKVAISTGNVTTIAGDQTARTSGFNDYAAGWTAGSSARFYEPKGIAIDNDKQYLYIADCRNCSIRKVNILTGSVLTIAGNGSDGYADDPDGTTVTDTNPVTNGAVDSQFFNPHGITADDKNLYVADSMNKRIRRIVISSGVVYSFAGGGIGTYTDGLGSGASFSYPTGITYRNGMVYVTEGDNIVLSNSIIRKISQDRQVVTIAGLANEAGDVDATGTSARFISPCAITATATDLYVCDFGNEAIRRIEIATGEVTTFFNNMSWFTAITTDGTNLYVCDAQTDPLIHMINISTKADISFDPDFFAPAGIATDGTNLYISGDQAIWKADIATQNISVFAGSSSAVPGDADGTGTAAGFKGPRNITTDGTNLYVADCGNHTIRKIVIATQEVSTIAGLAGTDGHADDADGYANGIASRLRSPDGITTDGASLYISEDKGTDESYVIRKIVISSGVVTTLSGKFGVPGCNDGPASNALFNSPRGLVFSESVKKLFICDWTNVSIRAVNP